MTTPSEPWSTPAARAAWKQEAAAEIATAAEQKVAEFHDFVDNLTDEDIAMLDRMTRETATEPPTYDGMWK